MPFEITVNGEQRRVDVAPDTPLLWVLRENLGLSGTKFGCGRALCGACTVHVDGTAVRSCSYPVKFAHDKDVRTIEGLQDDAVGKQVTETWIEQDVVQCGWCQPGQCMSAAALLASNPSPNDAEIDAAMSGNVCRCGTYPRIREAIRTVAKTLGGGGR